MLRNLHSMIPQINMYNWQSLKEISEVFKSSFGDVTCSSMSRSYLAAFFHQKSKISVFLSSFVT